MGQAGGRIGLIQTSSPRGERRSLPFFSLFKTYGFLWVYGIFSRIDRPREKAKGKTMKNEEIAAKLQEAAEDGKIPCAVAQRIATDNNVSMKVVGDLLNQMKIKIKQCQLGCF
jgi:hypothetical protein